MKNQILNLGFALKKAQQKEIKGGFTAFTNSDDCGGCIAWADSRDDGSDRTLKKWQKDLDDCRARSADCQE